MHTLTAVIEVSSTVEGKALLEALSAVFDCTRCVVNYAIEPEERDELSPRKLAPLRDFIAAITPMVGVGDVVREHLPKLAGMLADDAMAAWNKPSEAKEPAEMTAGPGQYIIRGSSGNLLIDATSGNVLRMDGNHETVTAYGNIKRFDLAEYHQWEQTASLKPTIVELQETDIWLIGYWYLDGDGQTIYSPACTGDRDDCEAAMG